jgi:hypothetical protein
MQDDLGMDHQGMDERLRAALLAEPVDTSALDARVRALVNRSSIEQRIHRGKWLAAASIAAVFVIAVGGYFYLPNRGNTAMCADAARDHRVEVVDHARRNWLTETAAMDALAVKHGFSAARAKAVAPAGYRLERGKLCRIGGRVFLHLVYSDGSHAFSFYLREHGGDAGPVVDVAGDHVAPVSSGQFTALVVTDESRAAAVEIARFAGLHL